MHCVAAFFRGDEACFHRNGGPGGRSNCASRYRLDPTHSLLLGRHLGRNLITLFSTVNTLCEKKSRSAPPSPAARAVDCRTHACRALAHYASSDRRTRKETSFFQRFFLLHAAHAAYPGHPLGIATTRVRDALQQVNAVFSPFRRRGVFPCRATPIARKCANFPTRSAVPKRRIARVDTVSKRRSRRVGTRQRHRCCSASRSGFASPHIPNRIAGNAHLHAHPSACDAKKKPLADDAGGLREDRSARRSMPARAERRVSGRLLPTVRHSRPARADR